MQIIIIIPEQQVPNGTNIVLRKPDGTEQTHYGVDMELSSEELVDTSDSYVFDRYFAPCIDVLRSETIKRSTI